jgi:WD40 repeat protein
MHPLPLLSTLGGGTEQCACTLQENESILVSSCGDGSIKVWDVAAPAQANPLRSFQEHTREVRLPCCQQTHASSTHMQLHV